MIILLAANTVLAFIMLAPLVLRMHFSVDSYFHLTTNLESFLWADYLTRASYTAGLLRGAQLLFGFDIVLGQQIFYIIMILSSAGSITIIARIFIRRMQSDSLGNALAINLGCALVFINPFIMELMLFPECALFVAFGSLLTALSVSFFVKEQRAMKLLSVLMLILALGVYQAYLGIFFALASILVWLRAVELQSAKFFLRNWLMVFGVALGAALFQVLFMQVYAHFLGQAYSYGTTTANPMSIAANIVSILIAQPHYFKWALGSSVLIPFCLLLCIMAIATYVTLMQQPLKLRLSFLLALVACYLCVFAIHTIAEVLWMPFRSVFGIWAVLSCFLLLPSLLLHKGWSGEKKGNATPRARLATMTTIAATSLLFLAVTVVVSDLSTDNKITQTADAMVAREINARITAYEEETGIKVVSIANRLDTNPTYNYPGIRYLAYESNAKAINTGWSISNLINLFGEREIHLGSMDDSVYDRYFAGKDWDTLQLDEQLVFVDNRAYLCNY